MTLLAPRPEPSDVGYRDDVPLSLKVKPTGADRVFNAILGGSSATVLLLLTAVVAFLCFYGYPALREAGFGLITDKTWSPDAHQFGMLPLLVGSIAIAVLAVVIATPISLSTALMINEYGPRRLKPWLTSVIDLLATVPSIVYGFWGLLVISNLQASPAKWLVHHAAFVPIFRTYSPTQQFGESIFACGLICAVTIIPIITSVSREVMAQVPRDVCEAALGLGGTRWGMVTDVIFPFSRNGILGAILLGLGRGLGETMIVVLVLSPGNHLTSSLMGPDGLGSTMAVNVLARLVVQRPIAAV
jgi:phosphate transport system permease protein